jgi:hypothetical protein
MSRERLKRKYANLPRAFGVFPQYYFECSLTRTSETDAKHVIAMEAIHRDPATAVSCFAEKCLLELAQMYLMSCEFKQ